MLPTICSQMFQVRKDLVLTVKTMLKQDTSFNVEHIVSLLYGLLYVV